MLISLESFEWLGRLSHQFTYENSNRFDWAGTDPDLVEVSRYPVLFEMEDSLAPRSSIHHTVISQLEYYFPNASMNYSQFPVMYFASKILKHFKMVLNCHLVYSLFAIHPFIRVLDVEGRRGHSSGVST